MLTLYSPNALLSIYTHTYIYTQDSKGAQRKLGMFSSLLKASLKTNLFYSFRFCLMSKSYFVLILKPKKTFTDGTSSPDLDCSMVPFF